MKIDIAHIAKLSRLHFEPEQIAKFEKDMESIVAMVDHLPDVSDTLTVDPNNAMRLREDVAKTTSSSGKRCLPMPQRYRQVVWSFRRR